MAAADGLIAGPGSPPGEKRAAGRRRRLDRVSSVSGAPRPDSSRSSLARASRDSSPSARACFVRDGASARDLAVLRSADAVALTRLARRKRLVGGVAINRQFDSAYVHARDLPRVRRPRPCSSCRIGPARLQPRRRGLAGPASQYVTWPPGTDCRERPSADPRRQRPRIPSPESVAHLPRRAMLVGSDDCEHVVRPPRIYRYLRLRHRKLGQRRSRAHMHPCNHGR